MPKFTKSVDELETHFDKWVFLLKHLPNLEEPPEPLQESVFGQLFEVAEIANFSSSEQETYLDSLKYYRDLNNVVSTSRQEGHQEGRVEGTKSLVLRLLTRKLGDLADGKCLSYL
ncbi:MAG: PD-(D/E)XK nuclease family transposase [Cyanobacteria bacterium J06626_18]